MIKYTLKNITSIDYYNKLSELKKEGVNIINIGLWALGDNKFNGRYIISTKEDLPIEFNVLMKEFEKENKT
jgi:hypothetical protein